MIPTNLVILQVLALQFVVAASQVAVPPLLCDNLCGLKSSSSTTSIHLLNLTVQKDPRLSDPCNEPDPKLESWANSSRLFLSYLGMNVSESACPYTHNIDISPYERNELRRSRPYDMRYLPEITGRKIAGSEITNRVSTQPNTWHVDQLPKDIQGSCITQVHRGVVRRKLSNEDEYSTDWLMSHTVAASNEKSKTSPIGWLFAFFADETGKARAITLPGESVPHALFWSNDKPRSSQLPFSMFANWSFEDIPDTSAILHFLEKTVDHLENIANEVSPSNIAILCLPLLMAIPPVSLLDSVSNKITVWYVFATDILATVPLLIKGVELIVGERNSEHEDYLSLSLIGDHFGIFERWYIVCRPNEAVRRFWIGVALVATALYFMVASTYAEFLFWRLMKYRRSSENKMDDIDVEAVVLDGNNGKLSTLYDEFLFWRAMRLRRRRTTSIDVENETQNTHADSEPRPGFQFSRSVIQKVLVVILSIGAVVAFVFALNYDIAARVALPILLVLIYTVGMKQLTLFRRWRFWVGIVFGFVCGPTFLFLHIQEKVRKSKNWGDISYGACIGIAALALTISIIVTPSYSTLRTALGVTIFPLFFVPSLIFVRLLRNTGITTDGENSNQNTDADSDSKLFQCSRPVIRKVLVVILSIGAVVAFVFALRYDIAARVALPILLVLTRAVGMKQVTLFRRWRFWAGIVFGFLGGPTFLFLHIQEKVRKSKNWGDISDGASIGIAALALTISISMTTSYSTLRVVLSATIFPLCFGSMLTIVNVIRSSSEDTAGWRYFVHGFATGMVYGPFGVLFIWCFPEMQGKERANFIGASAFGFVFVTSTSILFAFLSDLSL